MEESRRFLRGLRKVWRPSLPVTRRRSSHPLISTLSATLLTTSQGRDNSHPYATLCDSVCLPPPYCPLLVSRDLTLPSTPVSRQPPQTCASVPRYHSRPPSLSLATSLAITRDLPRQHSQSLAQHSLSLALACSTLATSLATSRPRDHDITLLHLVSSPRPHPRSPTHTPSIIPTAPAAHHQTPLIMPISSLVPLSVPCLD